MPTKLGRTLCWAWHEQGLSSDFLSLFFSLAQAYEYDTYNNFCTFNLVCDMFFITILYLVTILDLQTSRKDHTECPLYLFPMSFLHYYFICVHIWNTHIHSAGICVLYNCICIYMQISLLH